MFDATTVRRPHFDGVDADVAIVHDVAALVDEPERKGTTVWRAIEAGDAGRISADHDSEGNVTTIFPRQTWTGPGPSVGCERFSDPHLTLTQRQPSTLESSHPGNPQEGG